MPTLTPRLTEEEVSRYRDQGYLLLKRPILAQPKFDALKAHFEKKLADLPPGERPEAMDVPHFADPKLFEWLFDDDVLDLVEPILGPDIALFSSHFICKPKGDGRKVPWHEDSAYWNPMEVVTVWLAIDPSTPENGCMYVIPHTHNTGAKGYSDYEAVDENTNVFSSEILREQRDESRAVPCILEPNEASLHDGRIMHGSPPNHSDIRRCGYTMRYISTRSVLAEPSRETHQIYLARGRDLGNQPQNYGDPKRSYQELIDLRVRLNRKGH